MSNINKINNRDQNWKKLGNIYVPNDYHIRKTNYFSYLTSNPITKHFKANTIYYLPPLIATATATYFAYLMNQTKLQQEVIEGKNKEGKLEDKLSKLETTYESYKLKTTDYIRKVELNYKEENKKLQNDIKQLKEENKELKSEKKALQKAYKNSYCLFRKPVNGNNKNITTEDGGQSYTKKHNM